MASKEYHFYLQLQWKIEVHNKIVKNEFLAIGDMLSTDDSKICMTICLLKRTDEAKIEGSIVLFSETFYKG